MPGSAWYAKIGGSDPKWTCGDWRVQNEGQQQRVHGYGSLRFRITDYRMIVTRGDNNNNRVLTLDVAEGAGQQ